jgi:putative addiction module component (TIGR02574 family)
MATVDELFEQAMKLTEAEREELADRLYESTLPEVPGEEVSPEEAEAAWAEEIKRRSDDYHAGNTETLDAFESIERIRQELRERRVRP